MIFLKMNRLKFRIWDKQNKKWLENSSSLHCYSNWTICPFTGNLVDYIGLIDGDNNDTFYADPADDYYLEGTKLVKEPRYVIQQYTGLKDCDEKDIYEGDIIEYTYNVDCFRLSNGELIRGSIPSNETVQEKINQEVKWQGTQFIGVHPIIKIGYRLVDKKPQVIGNIFENPELIKNDE